MSEAEGQLPVLAGNWEEFSKDDVVHTQLAALRQYLAGKKTADECAQQLAATVPKAMIDGTAINDEDDSEDDYDAVYSAVHSLMSNLQHVAIKNPPHQDAIILLLHAMKRLPPQTVRAPTMRRHADAGEERIIWAELPNFTPQITDTYEYQKILFSKSPSDKATEWASVNAWIARLVSTDLYGPGGLDYYMHRASYNFMYVLDILDHSKFRGALPATANLFRYASPVLLRLCRDEAKCPDPPIGIFSADEVKHEEGKKVLFTKLGYSMKRWVWWKTRWEQLAGGEEVAGDIRAHAKDALAAMEEAEKSGA